MAHIPDGAKVRIINHPIRQHIGFVGYAYHKGPAVHVKYTPPEPEVNIYVVVPEKVEGEEPHITQGILCDEHELEVLEPPEAREQRGPLQRPG